MSLSRVFVKVSRQNRHVIFNTLLVFVFTIYLSPFALLYILRILLFKLYSSSISSVGLFHKHMEYSK